jgi:hypothetical protein
VPRHAHGQLDRLISIFEAARYGAGGLHEQQRDEALRALDAIVQAMRREAGLTWGRSPTRGVAA